MRVTVAIGLAILLLPTSVLVAQGPVQEFLTTDVGQVRPLVGYRTAYYFERDTDQGKSTMEWLDYDLRTLLPLKKSETQDLSLAARLRAIDINTSADIPGTCDAFPDHLWDISLTPIYRRKLNNGWLVGGSLSIGSPSDKPFASPDEYSAGGNIFVRIPSKDRNAWILFLNYANDREYCRNIPLPGAGYWYEPSKKFQALIGVPITSFQYDPIKQLRFEATYIAARDIHTQITYMPKPWLRFYTGFDWSNDRFFRHDRQDDDDLLWYYEKRIRGGVFVPLSRFAVLDISGGYAFDRFWFEGEDYSDRGDHRIDVGDGPFVSAQIIMRF